MQGEGNTSTILNARAARRLVAQLIVDDPAVNTWNIVTHLIEIALLRGDTYVDVSTDYWSAEIQKRLEDLRYEVFRGDSAIWRISWEDADEEEEDETPTVTVVNPSYGWLNPFW